MDEKEKLKNRYEFGMKIHELCEEYELSNKLTSSEILFVLLYKAHDLLHK